MNNALFKSTLQSHLTCFKLQDHWIADCGWNLRELCKFRSHVVTINKLMRMPYWIDKCSCMQSFRPCFRVPCLPLIVSRHIRTGNHPHYIPERVSDISWLHYDVIDYYLLPQPFFNFDQPSYPQPSRGWAERQQLHSNCFCTGFCYEHHSWKHWGTIEEPVWKFGLWRSIRHGWAVFTS